MPTKHPRYTVTDTGELREMLDAAGRRWPEVGDRRQLLLHLARAGREAIATEVDVAERRARRRRQDLALSRAGELLDLDALLADAAWR